MTTFMRIFVPGKAACFRSSLKQDVWGPPGIHGEMILPFQIAPPSLRPHWQWATVLLWGAPHYILWVSHFSNSPPRTKRLSANPRHFPQPLQISTAYAARDGPIPGEPTAEQLPPRRCQGCVAQAILLCPR